MKLVKILNIFFIIAMIIFAALGAILVFGQLFSVFALNGSLAVQLKALLFKPACAVSATACMISFVMRYLEQKK